MVNLKRRGFLLALATVAVSPEVASAKFSKFSVTSRDLPKDYGPYDAQPYYHPSVLKQANVDEEIWPAVKLINQSGWVWTLESCQGSHNWSPYPLIRLVSQNRNASRMLGFLHRSALHGHFGEPDTANRVEVYRHVEPPQPGWFEARALVKGPNPIGVFDRFAKAVNTGRITRGGNR